MPPGTHYHKVLAEQLAIDPALILPDGLEAMPLVQSLRAQVAIPAVEVGEWRAESSQEPRSVGLTGPDQCNVLGSQIGMGQQLSFRLRPRPEASCRGVQGSAPGPSPFPTRADRCRHRLVQI